MSLVRSLQKAHAGELAAYYAYEGHWRNVKNAKTKKKIQEIQKDELEHIDILKGFLKILEAKPDPKLDRIYTKIGKIISLLCYVSPMWLTNWVARKMEKIGTVAYEDISEIAFKEYRSDMAYILIAMAKVELDHDKYFKSLTK